MAVEVHGRDPGHEAYRVSVEIDGTRVGAMVPEALMSEELRRPGAPRHQGAYEWIADRAGEIERAIAAKHAGARVRGAFDRITLAEEN